MRIEFDWDPEKARSNRIKHGVAFEQAMMVFSDPFALSRLDEGSLAENDGSLWAARAATPCCWWFIPM